MLGVLLAQGQARGQDRDLLALDQLLDPPVGVVAGAQVPDRLARAGQVVEVAALHGDAGCWSTQACLFAIRAAAAPLPVRASQCHAAPAAGPHSRT